MKIASNKKIYFFILMFGTVFLPGSVLASTVYIDADHSEFFVGDTILFSVRIDSEGKNINAVEGSVLLDYVADAVSLTDINTSGSTFSLWPNKPLPSEDNTSISFAGGSPGGLNSKDAVVFNIVLKLQQAGQVTLAPTTLSVYLHDGKGTKDEVRVKNLVIDVLPNISGTKAADDWNTIISNDTTPPAPFLIYAGQEGSVFDGKKFLSFSTTDAQSGIAYYEVLEGTLPPVRSSDTYILQEQNKSVQVTIVAYDSAGNARESIYSSASPNYSMYFVIGIFAVLILVFVMYKKRKKFF